MRFFRSTAIFLMLVSPLGSLRPAAAVDLTNYTPFVASVQCQNVQAGTATACSGTVTLPNRQIVLEYVSFSCIGIPLNGRLYAASFATQVGGVKHANFLDLPVAASLGLADGATSGGQVVRIYADPNSSIHVVADIVGSSLGFACVFHLSGEQSP